MDSEHGTDIELEQRVDNSHNEVSDDISGNEQQLGNGRGLIIYTIPCSFVFCFNDITYEDESNSEEFYVVVDSELRSDIQLEQSSNHACGEMLHDSTVNKLQLGNDGTTIGSSVEMVSWVEQNDNMTQSSSGVQLIIVDGDDPYVGQEFESISTAHAFYCAYGMRLGFITRINYHTRSKRDGSIISQSFVCNKEGYRKPPKHEVKNVRPRAPTRVGCKAMISVRKMSSEKWVVTKFVKEHTHVLAGGGQVPKTVLYNQIATEDRRVQELTQQLLIERKRSASLRRCLDLLFNHIEEHTQDLSKKIQCIVEKIESEGKTSQDSR